MEDDGGIQFWQQFQQQFAEIFENEKHCSGARESAKEVFTSPEDQHKPALNKTS